MNNSNSHIASYLTAAALIAVIIKLLLRKTTKQKGLTAFNEAGAYFGSFFCGVLLVNGLVHFLHGAAGEDFAAPFGYLFTSDFLKHVSNVIWGTVNLALSYYLGARSNTFSNSRRVGVFFVGLFVMGCVLSYIFSK